MELGTRTTMARNYAISAAWMTWRSQVRYFHIKRSINKNGYPLIGVLCKQIHHVLINRKFRTSVLDTRCADIASDHHLVSIKLRLKLKVAPKRRRITRTRYDTQKVQNDGCRRQFRLELRNRFKILQRKELEDDETEGKRHLREGLQYDSRESGRESIWWRYPIGRSQPTGSVKEIVKSRA